MKAYHYPLQQLLNLDNIQLEQTQIEFAIAQKKLIEQEKLAQQTQQTITNHLNTSRKTGTNTKISQIQQYQKYLTYLQQKLNKQQNKVEEAQKELEQKRQQMNTARIKVRKLEKHNHKLHKVWEENLRKKEINDNDEINNVRTFIKKTTNKGF